MKVLAWSPTHGLLWGFSHGILSGAGPFCVQLFAPPLAFSKCGCPAQRNVSHEGIGLLAIVFLLWCFKTSQLLFISKILYLKKKKKRDPISPAALLKAVLRGKYFIHNGKYVVSPCMPSQHGTVGPPYSFVVVTPMGLGFNTSSKAIY